MTTEHPSLLGLAAALVTTLFVGELLRRGILREKFAALWLVVSVGVLVMAAFPRIVTWMAESLGVQVPANLLFFLTAVLLLLVSVQLSYEVSRLEARTRRLAEEVALLREQVRVIQERYDRMAHEDHQDHRET
jgi:hypothetical protein